MGVAPRFPLHEINALTKSKRHQPRVSLKPWGWCESNTVSEAEHVTVRFNKLEISKRNIYMHKLSSTITFAVIIILLSGCASEPQLAPSHLEINRNSVVDITGSTAGLSQTYFVKKESGYWVCNQPMPDAAFDQSKDKSFNFSVIGRNSEGGNDAAGSVNAEMVGRTPGVLMAREMFYRACEFTSNSDLSKDQAMEVYLKTLDAVSQGWAIEAGNTSVTVGDSIVSQSGITVSDGISSSNSAVQNQTTNETIQRSGPSDVGNE